MLALDDHILALHKPCTVQLPIPPVLCCIMRWGNNILGLHVLLASPPYIPHTYSPPHSALCTALCTTSNCKITSKSIHRLRTSASEKYGSSEISCVNPWVILCHLVILNHLSHLELFRVTRDTKVTFSCPRITNDNLG